MWHHAQQQEDPGARVVAAAAAAPEPELEPEPEGAELEPEPEPEGDALTTPRHAHNVSPGAGQGMNGRWF